ncbi:hypothetical protein DFP73DRAFT_548118 [Morchella snyderi]|nr:hypothetical protein DFP73DRAFT_548118 [Morchella snyderi]
MLMMMMMMLLLLLLLLLLLVLLGEVDNRRGQRGQCYTRQAWWRRVACGVAWRHTRQTHSGGSGGELGSPG